MPLKISITLISILIAIVHLIWPKESNIDTITLILLFISIVPWLSPIFKSLKFPGGWEIQFQELEKKVNSIVAKESEPQEVPSGPTIRLRAISVNDEITKSVIKALGNPKYTWRYLGGIAKETNLSKTDILKPIDWLLDNKLVNESKSGIENRTQWALTQEGRELFNILFQENNK